MPSQTSQVQVNQFVGGLNTEANPLSFPPNATTDELNVEIQKDGSRSQREGFDIEVDYTSVDTGITVQSDLIMGRSQFRWYNPGGNSGVQILVVQIGNYLGFHEITTDPISGTKLHSEVLHTDCYNKNFSYAVVDGILVVSTGLEEILVFEYDSGTITKEEKRLFIRDLFGVESYDGATELSDPLNYQVRPTTADRYHIYNLRNQTFALPRPSDINNSTLYDPIDRFITTAGNTSNKYPSNADNLNRFFSPTTGWTNPTVDRFQTQDCFLTRPFSTRAPTGYFIIDALDRGASRQSQLDELNSSNPELVHLGSGAAFLTDRTPGGASVVAEYAGRAWYAGFSSEVTNGDNRSPRMSSYVLFSQIVQSESDINLCYQKTDPTDAEDPNLVDSDGGFIRVSGAFDIYALVPLGPYLFVLARNGVWQISGVDQNTFTATSYSVSKISNFGCAYSNSVVNYGEEAFFWSDEGIMHLGFVQEKGEWAVTNITDDTIKTFYENISNRFKRTVVGYYDYRKNCVRWLYGVIPGEDSLMKELILNLKFRAFTYNTVENQGVVIGATSVVGGFPVTGEEELDITASSVLVTVSGVGVFIENLDAVIDSSRSFYCIVLDDTSNITYTFGGYSDGIYEDWVVLDGDGFLPSSYLISGPVSGNEGRLRKDVPYLTIHCKNFGANNSCLYSARWGWSQDVTTGRWSSTRNGYRLNSHHTNIQVVSTRNKVRGSGEAVAFKFENDGVAPLHLFGWEFNLNANSKE